MIILSKLLIETQSQASKEAERLGLIHVGWGRYANHLTGKVTHVSKDGKLVPIQSTGLRPRKIRGPIVPVPEPDEEELGKQIIPIEQIPTKKNPTLKDLSETAKKHKYVVMSKHPIKKINFADKNRYIGHDSLFKPIGIWYSVGSEWIDWVSHEMPEWKGDYLYSLEINPEKMLIIDTPEKFVQFNKKYEIQVYSSKLIDWSRVMQDYDGIQIATKEGEYFWQYRYVSWYNAWDVASGCIWRATTIRSASQIPVE